MTDLLLLCAACVAAQPSNGDAAFKSAWATTIYRGNALCLEHFRTMRTQEQDAELRR